MPAHWCGPSNSQTRWNRQHSRRRRRRPAEPKFPLVPAKIFISSTTGRTGIFGLLLRWNAGVDADRPVVGLGR